MRSFSRTSGRCAAIITLILTGCQAQQSKAPSEAQILTGQVAQTSKERDQYKADVAGTKADLEALQRKYDALCTERDNLAAKLATTESTLNQTKAEVQKVHTDLDGARTAWQKTHDDLEAARRNQKLVDDVAARMTATEGTLRATEQRNASLRQELGTTQGRLEEALAQNRQLQAKLAESSRAHAGPTTGPSARITIKSASSGQ